MEPEHCQKCGQRPRIEQIAVNAEIRLRVKCDCGRMGYHADSDAQAVVNWNADQHLLTEQRFLGEG